MARQKKPRDDARPHQVGVFLDGATLKRLDEWCAKERRSRSQAGSLFIEQGLQQAAKAAS